MPSIILLDWLQIHEKFSLSFDFNQQQKHFGIHFVESFVISYSIVTLCKTCSYEKLKVTYTCYIMHLRAIGLLSNIISIIAYLCRYRNVSLRPFSLCIFSSTFKISFLFLMVKQDRYGFSIVVDIDSRSIVNVA